jgi:hypothetical protein
MLPQAQDTSSVKVEIALLILACAAKSERDPLALKATALLIVMQCTRIPTTVHRIAPAATRAIPEFVLDHEGVKRFNWASQNRRVGS